MSTNYYLDAPHNEAGHLGKWTDGGRFVAKAPKGIDSFTDWAAQLDGHRIFAEHGLEYTATEMVQTALAKERFARIPSLREGEFIDRGVQFVRHAFF